MMMFTVRQKVEINEDLGGSSDEDFLDGFRGQVLTVLEKRGEIIGVEHYLVADENGEIIISEKYPLFPFPFIDADLQSVA